MHYNNNYHTCSGTEIFNLFAKHFQSVYIHTPNKNIIDTASITSNINIGYIHISKEEILDTLISIDVKKGYGPDNIHPLFIRKCAYYLSYLCLQTNH